MSGLEQDADVKLLGLKCGIMWFFGRRVAMPGDSFVCGGPKSQSVVNLLWSEGSRRPRV